MPSRERPLMGMIPIMRSIAVAAVLGCGTLPASAQTAAPAFDHEVLAKHVLERHIRPLYAAFADKAAALRATFEAECGQQRSTGDAAVRAAYRETVLAWTRTEHLRFGPVVDQNRFERVVYWPDRQKIGERQITQMLTRRDGAALEAGELSKKSVAVQGLTALEIVMFGKSGEALLTDAPDARFACAYARAIAANIDAIASEIKQEWGDGSGYAALWLAPGAHNAVYKTHKDTTVEILKAFRAGVYAARDLKLLPSLGLKRVAMRGQLAPKSRPPFELSGLSVAVMSANVEGALDLYTSGGLAQRLAAVEPAAAALTRTSLESAIAGLREMEPLGAAVFNEPAVMDKLAATRDPMGVALSEGAEVLAHMAGLGAIVLGFSDDDGD